MPLNQNVYLDHDNIDTAHNESWIKIFVRNIIFLQIVFPFEKAYDYQKNQQIHCVSLFKKIIINIPFD